MTILLQPKEAKTHPVICFFKADNLSEVLSYFSSLRQ